MSEQTRTPRGTAPTAVHRRLLRHLVVLPGGAALPRWIPGTRAANYTDGYVGWPLSREDTIERLTSPVCGRSERRWSIENSPTSRVCARTEQ
jgi:hypothetical protein